MKIELGDIKLNGTEQEMINFLKLRHQIKEQVEKYISEIKKLKQQLKEQQPKKRKK